MKNLTDKEKEIIAVEMLNKQPVNTIGLSALLRIALIAIQSDAPEVIFTKDTIIDNKKYLCKMEITYKELIDGRVTKWENEKGFLKLKLKSFRLELKIGTNWFCKLFR
jgi:hypothetical protein